MTSGDPEVIARSVESTHAWLRDLCDELGSDDRRYAYRALRAPGCTSCAIACRSTTRPSSRRRCPGSCCGVYYEGWRPSATPQELPRRGSFLDRVAAGARLHGETEASFAAEAVARLLRRRVSAGEIPDVLAVLPAEVRTLFAGSAD